MHGDSSDSRLRDFVPRSTVHAPRSTLFLAFAILHGHAAVAVEEAERALEIGTSRQLFVDDFLVADAERVTRQLGQVTKVNGGRPIFTGGWFYGTVLFDDGRFKLWYRKPGQAGYGYAESDDGLKFEPKAALEGINFAGDFTLSVMIDPHETDPLHRYKGAYDGPGMAAAIAHSADGIHWTPYHKGQAVTTRAADTYNQILWDEGEKTYRLLTRTDFGTAGGSGEVRGHRTMINPDVKSNPAGWQTARSWIFDREGADEPRRRQIYALCHWIHEGVHMALMSVYEWPGDVSEGPADLTRRHERDVLNYYLATSRDGVDWDTSWIYDERPLVPRGPDGAFDKDIVFPGSSIVTHQDRHWIYYAGGNERHGTPEVTFPRVHAIGLATLPLDRFVGFEAGDDEGIITTRPFRLDGSGLEVNVDAADGSLAVEVLDADGRALSGFARADAVETQGVDKLHLRPRWNDHKDLGSLVGQVVRLRFYIQRARLYAFQVLRGQP